MGFVLILYRRMDFLRFQLALLKEKDILTKTYALCIRSPSDKRPCYVGNFQYDDGIRMHEDGPWYDDSRDTYFQILDNVTWTENVGIMAMKRISTKPDSKMLA